MQERDYHLTKTYHFQLKLESYTQSKILEFITSID
jgi:hypothetical protein